MCREREGNARQFQCIYHGWTYNTDGSIKGIPGDDAYPPGYDKAGKGLVPVPRLEHYKDFYFASFDADAPDLASYLAGAKDYIDLVIDQSPSGRMEIISGVQEYDIKANWKLLVENSVDDYHLVTTHSTWLNYMRNSGVNITPAKGHMLPTKGFGKDLGNGHLTTDNPNYRGRPVAKWISVYGEEAKADIDAIRKELVERLGEARAARVADTNRNLCIFPNLVINDGSSVTVRNFFPVAPGHMKVIAWALGPIEETEAQRARRLHAFLTFYGPGGFATPDDIAALELAQQGFAAWREVPWSDLSRGMGSSQEQLAHRRRPSAGVLAQVERIGGGAAMNAPVAPGAVTRAEVEDFLYHEADLLDRWKLDDWLGLLTEDAAYYVPPNDKPDADHRFTLFTVADDIVRLRERIIRLKDPNCHAEFPPSRTRRMISNVRITGMEGELILAEANFAIFRHRRNEPVREFVGRYRHKLKRTDDGLKIHERRAILDAEELGPMGSVSFLL